MVKNQCKEKKKELSNLYKTNEFVISTYAGLTRNVYHLDRKQIAPLLHKVL